MEIDRHPVFKNRWIIATMAIIFVVYNYVVYTQGTSNTTPNMSNLALKGERLYQENNCTSCHQLFGLGGYLGPDLTNIISNDKKGAPYANAFLNSGVKAMPKFNFSEEEKTAIVQFLTEIDQCGFYPIVEASTSATGWVEMKYKNQ